MADNKQYIIQTQDNGSVLISEEVISSIVAVAVREVDGVAGLAAKPGAELAEMLGKKNWGNGVRLTVSPDNALSIDCDINVEYGATVIAAAGAVQDSVRAAVESMPGRTVTDVNVNVCGIAQK